MVQAQTQSQHDPRYQTQNILKRLKEDIDQLRTAITEVDEREFVTVHQRIAKTGAADSGRSL